MPKGFQTCDCGALVRGARTLVCPECNGDLKKDKKMAIDVEPDNTADSDGSVTRTVYSFPEGYCIPDSRLILVHIPAGIPPIRLGSEVDGSLPDDDALTEWAGNVRQELITSKNQYIKNPGLVYWARQELNGSHAFRPSGDEMKHVGLVIGSIPDITTRQVEA